MAGAYFTNLIRTRSDCHEVLKGQDMLQALGMVGSIPDPKLWLSEESTVWAADFVARHRLDRFGVLAVSAGSKSRIWPVENFLPVIDAVRKATDLTLVILGASDALESAAWLKRMRPDAVVCATGSVPILSSAALLALSDIYIGMDSGLMHVAAASRVPVVEISCHPVAGDPSHRNSPSRFGPYATRNRVVQPASPLSPCVHGCSISHAPHCITQIEPSKVIDAALELLNGSI
jgi:ADP-heptose:LPS heptosyltransferase